MKPRLSAQAALDMLRQAGNRAGHERLLADIVRGAFPDRRPVGCRDPDAETLCAKAARVAASVFLAT